MPRRSMVVEIGWALGAGILATLVAAWVLDLGDTTLSQPWSYASDGFFYQAVVKGVIDHGWFLHNPDLGAPYGLDMQDFPVIANDLLQVLIVKVLGIFGSSPFTVVNAFYLLTFVLDAGIAFGVMRRLGASHGPAFVGSVLFATLPYHFLKGEHQLFFSSYYTVPLIVLLVLGVASGEKLFGPRRRTLITVALCAVIAAASIYYSVFFALLALAAGVVRLAATRERSTAVSTALLLVVLGGFVFAYQIPTVLYRLDNGSNAEVAERDPAESEYFALKIDQMVLPIAGHRIDALSDIGDEMQSTTRILGEPTGNLGLLGVIGLAWLVLVGLAAAIASRAGPGSERERQMSVVAVFAILLATVGGLSAVIAFTVSPQIRSWGRMSIVVGFLALLAVALLLERAHGHWNRYAYGAALAVVLLLGVLDQTSARYAPDHELFGREYASDAGFVHDIEERLPDGAMVLNLPYAPYPENLATWGDGDYEHMRGYLSSSSLRWSYGAMRGRPEDWHAALEEVPLATLLDGAAAGGFDGILVDTAAYSDPLTMAQGIEEVVGSPATQSADGRLLFWDLRPYAAGLGEGERERLREAAMEPVRPRYGTGFDYQEGSGDDRWRWGRKHAELELHNPHDEPRPMRLSVLIRTDSEQAGTTTITLPDGRTVRARTDKKGTRVRERFDAPPGRSVVAFDAETTPVLATGRGELSFQARNLVAVGDGVCRRDAWSCAEGNRPHLR